MAKRHKTGVCRNCGCTEQDCRECVELTGEPCSWVQGTAFTLCTACTTPELVEQRIELRKQQDANGKHWSEASCEFYYVGSPADEWEHFSHDVESESLANEVAGMYIVRRDGSNQPAPITRAAWELLANLYDDEADDVACCGRIVDGVCMPIGAFDNDGFFIDDK